MKIAVSTIIFISAVLMPLVVAAQEEGYQISKKLDCVADGEQLFLERDGERLTTSIKKRILKKLRKRIRRTDSDRRLKKLREKRQDVKDCGAVSNDDSNSDDGRNCPKGFDKQVKVFGIRICATDNVPDTKLLHAARIMAQYLDNDENGEADDPLLIEQLVKTGVLEMFKNQKELDNSNINYADSDISQPLFAHETHPGQMDQGVFDFALEEILHLISSAGWHFIYPNDLGEDPGSRLTAAMDTARGGQFFTIPNPYPDSAWYTYDDETCEYICMASEYFYWALTSLLGAQDIPGRLEEIEHEWRPNTREKLQSQDPAIYELLTDPSLKLPSVLPDGNYAGGEFSITEL